MKICSKCGAEKPLSEFYRLSPRKYLKATHFPDCKECNKARAVAWTRQFAEQNPEEHAARRARYARKAKLRGAYGLTEEEYGALLAAQGGKCAICGTADPGRNSTYFPVDHDHQTGEVRGLLCHECNLSLAGFDDDPERLMSAVAYLLARQNVLGVVF